MDKNDSYFYLSGILSLLLFLMVFTLFSVLVISSQKAKSYALKKDKYIAVSINLVDNTITPHKTLEKPFIKAKSKSNVEDSVAKIPDISSLFSTVSTKKIIYKKRVVKKRDIINKNRVAQMQKRIKTTKKRKSSDAKRKIENLKLTKASVKEVGKSASSGVEVNKYYAKIQAFVYKYFYPPVNSEGTSAKVRIWLNANGRLSDYRVMAYSSSSIFNKEVDQLRSRLFSITFPKHPENRSLELDIILVSEE